MRLPRKYLLKGQALILVLLGMAVVLTLVLSIVSTSITDIDVSTRDEEATRALNAAEAGVEQSFLIADDSSGTIGEYSQYSAVVTGIAEGSTIYNSPKVVDAGDTVALWYVSHNGNDLVCDPLNGFPCMAADTSLKICFGNDPKPENAPAIRFFHSARSMRPEAELRFRRRGDTDPQRTPKRNFFGGRPPSGYK